MNTSVLEGDTAEAVTRLKQEQGENIIVNGSAALVRSLLREGLLDELRLYVHPVVVGSGERLFGEGADELSLTLADSRAYDSGIVSLTYRGASA